MKTDFEFKTENFSCNIFLIANYDDESFSAVYSDEPIRGAVPFVREQEYPVEFSYYRIDLNGCSIRESEEIKNRKELLDTLNFAGKAGWQGFKVWDLDITEKCRADICSLVNMTYAKVKRINYEHMQIIYEDFMESEKELFEKIVKCAEENNIHIGEPNNQKHYYYKYIDIGGLTPLGEEWKETVRFDGTNSNLITAIRERYQNFDVDEELKNYINAKDMTGVLWDMKALHDEAKWKKETLGKLAETLELVEKEFNAPSLDESVMFVTKNNSLELNDIDNFCANIDEKIIAAEKVKNEKELNSQTNVEVVKRHEREK